MGTLQEVYDYFKDKKVKGEIVIVIAGAESKQRQEAEME